MSLFDELRRRNVFRVAIAYVVVAWLVAQVLGLILDSFGSPPWVMKTVLVLLAAGLVFAVFFSWAFEMTPEGLRREHEVDRSRSITGQTGRKLDRMILAVLGLVVAWLAFDELYLDRRAAPVPVAVEASPQAPLPQRQSVAVLPFRTMSSGENDAYFADGLTEEILNYLTGLPELLVTARTSAFFFKDQDLPIPEIAARLGVDHVVEGSVRRSGDQVRVTAQLVRASDGFHLWSQTYDRTLQDVFALQEDIAANIASKLDVVLDEHKLASMRRAGIGDVDAFIAYQRGMDLFSQAHQTANPMPLLDEANRWFDRALERVPDIGNALYLRTDLYGHKLFDHAGNFAAFPQAELDDALAEIRSSLARAIRAANNEPLRAALQTELALFSDDWRGLTRRLEKAFEPGDCNWLNWMSALGAPYGWAGALATHQLAVVQCDPLAGTPVWQAAQALTWDGRAEEALVMVERWLEQQGYEAWADDSRYFLLQATGRWVDEPGFFGPTPADSTYQVPRTIFGHAIANQIAEARALFDDFSAREHVDDMNRVLVGAALGDRQLANEAAAAIDARLGGPLLLISTVENCFCGAPFDLEATPRFRARIEEAGLAWPPPTPIRFPAKQW